jgi:hypothetical protein
MLLMCANNQVQSSFVKYNANTEERVSPLSVFHHEWLMLMIMMLETRIRCVKSQIHVLGLISRI